MVVWALVLSLMVIAALWTVVTSVLLRTAIGLALTSIMLAVLLFMMGATLAAVFELSVCAGLIPALFVSVISMTRRQLAAEHRISRRIMLRRFWPLPLALAVVGLAMSFIHGPVTVSLPVPTDSGEARAMMWNFRRLDLFGQILILLAGVYGVVVLFKKEQS